MNHIWIFEEEIEKTDEVTIKDPIRLEHVHHILKSRPGDKLKVILLDQGLALAELTSLDQKSATLKIGKITKGAKRFINILVGLSRPQTVKKILELSSNFPVSKVHFFRAELSEKSYADSKIFEEEKTLSHLLSGLAQVGRFDNIPEVFVHNYIPFNKFEDIERKILFHPDTDKTLMDFPLQLDDDLVLALGPERGLTKKEEDLFTEKGFEKVSLSPSIFRVETALTAALSQIELVRQGHDCQIPRFKR